MCILLRRATGSDEQRRRGLVTEVVGRPAGVDVLGDVADVAQRYLQVAPVPLVREVLADAGRAADLVEPVDGVGAAARGPHLAAPEGQARGPGELTALGDEVVDLRRRGEQVRPARRDVGRRLAV